MKLEVGKFYKNGRGQKVKIIAIDAELAYGGYPAVGVVEGRLEVYPENGETAYFECSLVREWEEPKPKLLAYMNKGSGIVHFYTNDVVDVVLNNLIRVPHLDFPEDKE